MIRTKDGHYWSDALYLARAKNELELKESGERTELFQCAHCSAFVKFNKDKGATSGKWIRIKPYEQFQLQKKYEQSIRIESLKEIRRGSGTKKLYQCPSCASYWWNDQGTWDRADDESVHSLKNK